MNLQRGKCDYKNKTGQPGRCFVAQTSLVACVLESVNSDGHILGFNEVVC